MKARVLLVLTLAVLLMTVLTVSAADTDTPATTGVSLAAEQDGSDADADAEDTEESEDVRFTKPTLKLIAGYIKTRQDGLSDSEYLAVMKLLNMETAKDLNGLYAKFRANDADVLKRGDSTTAKAAMKKYKLSTRIKKQGKVKKMVSDRFIVYYPEKMAVVEKRKLATKATATALELESLITEVEDVFDRTTQEVLMNNFINWAGKVRAKIFVIVNADDWQSLRTGSVKSRPVQTVITKDGNREFYVYASPKSYDYSKAALKYAVAELVLKEYSKITGGERESKLPEFFLAGLATKISELDSVITDNGPVQLKKYNGKNITGSMLRKLRVGDSGVTQLPLYTRKLLSFESLVRPKSLPGNNEMMYYYIRQSSALVDYLSQNGALAFLTMSEALSDGDRFEKAFDDRYVEVRDKLSGKESSDSKKSRKSSKMSRDERRKQRKDEKDRKGKLDTAEDILNGYKELRRNAEDVIFVPLTVEYMQENKPEKKTRSKKRPGGPPNAPPSGR